MKKFTLEGIISKERIHFKGTFSEGILWGDIFEGIHFTEIFL